MQEPSLQVKSIEGHGAKSTGAPPAKTDTAWYSWSTTAVSSSFVPRFSARADNVEARAEVVMMVYMWFAHVFVYIYIYSNVNTRMYTKHARGSTTWTRDARVERTHLKRGGISVYIYTLKAFVTLLKMVRIFIIWGGTARLRYWIMTSLHPIVSSSEFSITIVRCFWYCTCPFSNIFLFLRNIDASLHTCFLNRCPMINLILFARSFDCFLEQNSILLYNINTFHSRGDSRRHHLVRYESKSFYNLCVELF